MFDHVEYTRCPFCAGKKMSKTVNEKVTPHRVIIKCEAEDCGNVIDTYPVEKTDETK